MVQTPGNGDRPADLAIFLGKRDVTYQDSSISSDWVGIITADKNLVGSLFPVVNLNDQSTGCLLAGGGMTCQATLFDPLCTR